MPSRSRERRTSRPFLSMAVVLALAAGVAVAPPASARIVGVRVAGDLRQSVAFTFDAQDRLWVVEKQVGSIYVQRLGSDRRRRFFKIPDVHGRGGQGLLGIALHPKFPDSPWRRRSAPAHQVGRRQGQAHAGTALL
jgi:hypothetical protein